MHGTSVELAQHIHGIFAATSTGERCTPEEWMSAQFAQSLKVEDAAFIWRASKCQDQTFGYTGPVAGPEKRFSPTLPSSIKSFSAFMVSWVPVSRQVYA